MCNDHIVVCCLQEKLKGKNKLVPRLLGITRDSVVRVDEKTKEVCRQFSTRWILQKTSQWPLWHAVAIQINYYTQILHYWSISAGEIYSTICVEWAVYHLSLGLT